MSDFKQIAEDAVELCKIYEGQIADLKSKLAMSKTASTVDTELVKKSVDALIKAGKLLEDQKEEATACMTSDPNASLRAIQALCETHTDAHTLVKNLSLILEGGKLGNTAKKNEEPAIDAYAEMAKVLGFKLN